MTALLASYPRKRSPLPDAHRAIYDREFSLNRSGGSFANRLTMKLEGWMHRVVAARGISGSVLEIGAGTLNHLPYESETRYDIVEPQRRLWESNPLLGRVRRAYSDLAEVSADESYDRVLSIAVLEHLEALPETVARGALLLRPGGLFQAAIPSEGGFLWGAAWRLTTGIGYRLRNGLPYGPLMRWEHVNEAPEIEAVIGHFFRRTSTRRFPLPAHHLSFYSYVEASEPDLERCRAYLSRTRT